MCHGGGQNWWHQKGTAGGTQSGQFWESGWRWGTALFSSHFTFLAPKVGGGQQANERTIGVIQRASATTPTTTKAFNNIRGECLAGCSCCIAFAKSIHSHYPRKPTLTCPGALPSPDWSIKRLSVNSPSMPTMLCPHCHRFRPSLTRPHMTSWPSAIVHSFPSASLAKAFRCSWTGGGGRECEQPTFWRNHRKNNHLLLQLHLH